MLRVRVSTSGWSGGPGLNTFYFGGDESLAHAYLCVTRVHTVMAEAATLYPASVVAVVSTTVDAINSTNGDLINSFSTASVTDIPGSQTAGDILPAAVAMLLRLQTTTFDDGSRIQGRAFFSPLGGALRDTDGTPQSGAITALESAGDALLDSGLADADAVVWRRPRKAVPTATPPITARVGSTALITSTSVPNKFATLRSRRD